MSIRSSPVKSAVMPPIAYGWFGGGYSASYSNVIDRITLADDTTNAIDRCDLSNARYAPAGFTDGTHGWFGGGVTPAASDRVDRITLADDTTNALDRCNLALARGYLAGITDGTHGWFGEGTVIGGMVDRITLADDTTNALDRCRLTMVRRGLAGITDDTYGWFAGGYSGDGDPITLRTDRVDRITLADDTTNALDRCNLALGRGYIAGFTDKTHGWFAGGDPCGACPETNVIDRITLADDTTNALDRCDLSLARSYLAGITDDTYGWFAGGWTGSATSNRIDRITLATDTNNALDKCDLSIIREAIAGFKGSA